MKAKQDSICETERLYLREITVADAVFAFELNSDAEVLKYTGDEAFLSIEEATEFLAGYTQYRLYGFGRWAVIRKLDNEILGWCGLKYDAETKEHDLGFRFFKKYWNLGYASEAAMACVDLAFEKFNIEMLYGNVDRQNFASQRVLEKVHMQRLPECGRHAHEYRYLLTNKMWSALRK